MYKRLFYILIATLYIYSSNVSAQSKPKRDTSKDKSVIVAQKKAKAKIASKNAEQKKAREVTKRKKKTPSLETPKAASYLRVNQLLSLSRNINSSGGGETFKVNTDGKEWNVVALPTWCHLTKYSDSFYVSFEPNSSHNDRSDWFKVISDNHEVRIDINQLGAPLNISAHFGYSYLQHNISMKNIRGFEEKFLKISTSMSIRGARDQKCLVVALITDEYNKNIKAASGYSYYSIPSTNDVFTSVEIIPKSDESQSFDLVLYLPNNAIGVLKKRNSLRCHLALFCEKTGRYISDANYIIPFKTRGKKGKVKTKSM